MIDTDGNSANASFSLIVAAPPRLTARQESGGEITLTLTGGAAGIYVMEATSDFATWETIGTMMTPAGSGQFTDNSARYFLQRFYRAVPQ